MNCIEPTLTFAPSNFRKMQRFFSSAANIQAGTTSIQGEWRMMLSYYNTIRRRVDSLVAQSVVHSSALHIWSQWKEPGTGRTERNTLEHNETLRNKPQLWQSRRPDVLRRVPKSAQRSLPTQRSLQFHRVGLSTGDCFDTAGLCSANWAVHPHAREQRNGLRVVSEQPLPWQIDACCSCNLQ